MVKYATLHMVTAISKRFHCPLDQIDVVNAFLYRVMNEKIFCVSPEGVEMEGDFDCLELVNAIDGLNQDLRVWNETFDESVCSIGLQLSGFDPCRYIMTANGQCVFALGYVDDTLVSGSSLELSAHINNELKTCFEMKGIGKCAFILGTNLWTMRSKCDYVSAPLCG